MTLTKKVIKILSVLAIIFSIVLSSYNVFAANKSLTSSDGKSKGSAVLATDENGDIRAEMYANEKLDVDKDNKIGAVGQSIATIIRNVGYAIAGVIILVLGLKYLMGSVEQKAEYKKTMMPYIVGAILLFGVSTVITFVQELGNAFK